MGPDFGRFRPKRDEIGTQNLTKLSPEEARIDAAPSLGMVRRHIMEQATSLMGALGEEMIPVTSHEAGGSAGWHTLMMPVMEIPCWELSDDLLRAERVTRVTDAHRPLWRCFVNACGCYFFWILPHLP